MKPITSPAGASATSIDPLMPQEQHATPSSSSSPPAKLSPIYRHKDFTQSLSTKLNATTATFHDILCHAEKNHADLRGVGARPLLRIHKELRPIASTSASSSSSTTNTNTNTNTNNNNNNTTTQQETPMKEWQLAELGDYVWTTYSEFASMARRLSASLIDGNGPLGLQPGKDIACIYSKTCPEWQIAAHACFSQSLTITTAYESLGVDGLAHVLSETECPLVFLQPELAATLVAALKAKKTSVRAVILLSPVIKDSVTGVSTETEWTRGVDAKARAALTGADAAVAVYSLPELLAQVGDAPASRPPTPESAACIMYTSGSTGVPKGVVLTHGNLVASAAGMLGVLPNFFRAGREVYIAYLPLAHVLEFVVEGIMIFSGVVLGYGSPRTLADAAVRGCAGDIRALRPTFMAGVPAVWESIAKGIAAKVAAQPAPVRALFHAAVCAKRAAHNYGVPCVARLLDMTILRRVVEQTGGRLRRGLSGGAGISAPAQSFLTGALCPIFQGYGMTETCAGALLCDPFARIQERAAGAPIGAVEVRLRDASDVVAGYTIENATGELLVRGANVFSGYFRSAASAAPAAPAADADGWFRTGDIARRDPRTGLFYIIDRVKNLVKLSNGEYIALENLESVYATVACAVRVCLVVGPNAAFPLAVIHAHPPEVVRLAQALGVRNADDNDASSSSVTWIELCARYPALRAAMQRQFVDAARAAKLSTGEIPRAVIVSDVEWLPESGLVTAAMKLQRAAIYERYRAQIEREYERLQVK